MEDEFLQQFGLQLARRLNVALPFHTIQTVILQTIREARAAGGVPDAVGRDRVPESGGQGNLFGHEIEIVFVHDCRNHGCNVPYCVLCKHNPNKRCTGNFAGKYWVGDRLLAKCEGEIQVELIDVRTGDRVVDDLSNYRLEVCILDGNRYNKLCREAGEQRLHMLDECEVLLNQKLEPLLQSANANNTKSDPRVLLKFQPGTAMVPLREVKVTESSESVLAGTKRPPFRLVVRMVHESGRRLQIRPAVSEEFVVVTKRTKNLKKQDIPSLDDPIAKLNHVGKETVKKLNELKNSADEIQMDLHLPVSLSRITKVRDFLSLVKLSEEDGHLQQKLKQLLKLSKEKWEAACEHAKTAVQMDNRMRAWYNKNMSVGLLYTCTMGGVRPDRPVALIQNHERNGTDVAEVVPMEHQLPQQREQVQGTCEFAIRSWWEDTHPGWMIFTLGNQHFETLDQIIKFSKGMGERPDPTMLDTEGNALAAPPQLPSDEDRAVADSVSSGRSDHAADHGPHSYKQPHSKQSETQPAPHSRTDGVSLSNPPAVMTNQSHLDTAHSPSETLMTREDQTRDSKETPSSVVGLAPDLAHQQHPDFPNPFENLSADLYRRDLPAQSVQPGLRDAATAAAAAAVRSPFNVPMGGGASQSNPIWLSEGLFPGGYPGPANLPFMLSLETIMKMGSLPSLQLNESGFNSFVNPRPYGGDLAAMQGFAAANFGHPSMVDPGADSGRAYPVGPNPYGKRRLSEQAADAFPEKQPRIGYSESPAEGTE